ncbi:cell cycle control protein cwf19 [Tirmania nivea]|nr:cell cycle control protein cwf19 [Tirmania nivea]
MEGEPTKGRSRSDEERKDRKDTDRSRERDKDGNRDRRRERDSDRHKDREDGRHRDSEDRHRSHISSQHHRGSGEKRCQHRERDRERERDKRDDKDRERRHHKRSRHHDSDEERREGSSSRRHRHKSRRSKSPSSKVNEEAADTGEGQWVEKSKPYVELPQLRSVSPIPEDVAAKKRVLKRDTWMVQAEQDAFDFTQRGPAKQPESSHREATKPDYAPIIHKMELNTQLSRSLDEYKSDDTSAYTFGDSGSNWRMMKLKRVYEVAEETGKSVEEVALEKFGDLKSFDEAREERQELDRRQMYGNDRPDSKDRPTGHLHASRIRELQEKERLRRAREPSPAQGQRFPDGPHTTTTKVLNQTTLNRMQAALLKAQLRGDPKCAEMEKEYNAALAQFANQKEPEVVVLSAMDSRMLAHGIGGRGEVKEITKGKRKGQLVDNDDMSLEDMLREEKRTRGQIRGGEGRMFAEQIAKDAKFDASRIRLCELSFRADNLDYIDENADRLAKRIHKNAINLKNVAISDFKKMQRVLDTCPLCSHENRDAPPIAPVVSLGTRVFLTLPTLPELSSGGAMIVPIQHRTNTLECDDDEWEEIRNFMKSLIRMYHHQGRGVIFYENAASPSRKRHAAITAVPMPLEVASDAPAYFREAILSSASEWSQHRKLLNTLKPELGKRAFRSTLVKEMPYFHVWFEIDGGMGHIVEDENKWPKGDLFAREVIGGMLDADELSVVKRQGRWTREDTKRVEPFRKAWNTWDWTRVLLDGTTGGA